MASFETKTNDGTEIKVSGVTVPEMPSIDAANPPSNKEIDANLSQAKAKLEENRGNLNAHGQKIVGAAEQVLDSTSTLIHEKNQKERFQKLFLFTKGAATSGTSEGMNEAVQNLMKQAAGIGSTISNDATDVASYIRETVYNLTTSADLRQVGVEFLTLLQSLIQQLSEQIEDAKTDVQTKADPLASQGQKLANKAGNLKDRALAQAGALTEDEQVQRIRERLINFLSQVSQHQEYQSVVNNFFKYSEQIYDLGSQASEQLKNTKESDELTKLMDDAWGVIGDFVGKDMVAKFRKDLQKVLQKVRDDAELRAWMKEARSLLETLMKNPDEGARKQHDAQIDALIRKGRSLTQKHRSDLDGLYNDASRMLYRIRNDPVLNDFSSKLEQLGRNLALNSKGQPDLYVMEESLVQIKNLVVEMFRGFLVDIPIERVDIRNEDMDVTLTDISLKGTGLVPDTVFVKMGSYSTFHFQKSPDAQTHFRLRLKIEGIKPEFKGVRFSYHRKTFPQMTDNGVTDVIFEGNGISAEALVHFQAESGEFAKARAVSRVTLDTVKLNIDKSQTKHDTIDTIFAPYAAGQLRTKIEHGLNDWLRSRLNELTHQLNDWFATRPFDSLKRRANEALKDAPQTIQKTLDSTSKQFDQLKSQASDAVDQAKDKASQAVDQAKDKASQAVDQAKEKVNSVQIGSGAQGGVPAGTPMSPTS